MAVKQWGFVHAVRPSMDAPQRAEFLIGYPFAFTASSGIKLYYTGAIALTKLLMRRGLGF